MGIGEFNAGGNSAVDSIPPWGRREGGEILLVAPCYRKWDKLWPDGPLGSNAHLTHHVLC